MFDGRVDQKFKIFVRNTHVCIQTAHNKLITKKLERITQEQDDGNLSEWMLEQFDANQFYIRNVYQTSYIELRSPQFGLQQSFLSPTDQKNENCLFIFKFCKNGMFVNEIDVDQIFRYEKIEIQMQIDSYLKEIS